jgi:hypothetical protein
VLAKVLLHNLTCIVHAIEEFGIDLAPRTCPHCGRAPDESDFVDEKTVVEDRRRETVLKLVK